MIDKKEFTKKLLTSVDKEVLDVDELFAVAVWQLYLKCIDQGVPFENRRELMQRQFDDELKRWTGED